MKLSETAALLATVAAFDNRHTPEEAVHAWASALHPDITLEDARKLAVEHYSSSTEWLKPAHINAAFKQLRRHRLDAAGTATPPPQGLTAVEEQVWVKAFRRAIGAGATPEQADQYAAQQANPAVAGTLDPSRHTPDGEDPAAREQGIALLRAAITSVGK